MDMGPTLINPSILAEIIGSLMQKLRALYVFPEIAMHLCENLQKHLDNGDYTDLKEGELLTLALTIHLQDIAHDEHLWVRWHREPLPEDEQALRKSKAWQAERRLEAQLDNYGLHRVERLTGSNCGCRLMNTRRLGWPICKFRLSPLRGWGSPGH